MEAREKLAGKKLSLHWISWASLAVLYNAKVLNVNAVCMPPFFVYFYILFFTLSYFLVLINKSHSNLFSHTFSGNQGVIKGIWNVLLYECNVSNDSGDTAPSIEKTPRENWLQTAKWKVKKKFIPVPFVRKKNHIIIIIYLRVQISRNSGQSKTVRRIWATPKTSPSTGTKSHNLSRSDYVHSY